MKDNSTLAKLLAEEDLFVIHKQVETASFNVETRELVLPIWKDMSKPVQDMLTLHEVGHALYTPLSMLKEAKERKIEFSFVNVIEDARIERLIQNKYLGSKYSFKKGYTELDAKDFFDIKGKDISKLGLIDRINLYFKNVPNVPFSNDEQVWVDRVANTKTPDDVLNLAEELYDYQSQEEESQEQEQQPSYAPQQGNEEGDTEKVEIKTQSQNDSNNSDDSQNETEEKDIDERLNKITQDETVSESEEEKVEVKSNGKYGSDSYDNKPIVAKTDNTYSKSLDGLRDKNAEDRTYLKTPKINLDKIIISSDKIFSAASSNIDDSSVWDSVIDDEFSKVENSSKKVVSYLVKEFEMKKAASQYARASVSKTGSLDMSKLHTYKFNDDLFAKVTNLPGATNHGMVMFLDWSGSMAENLAGTMKQLFNLVWFCNRVKIPFEVYAFTSNWNRIDCRADEEMQEKVQSANHGELDISNLRLLNFLSSKMKKKDQSKMMKHMLKICFAYDRQTCRNLGYWPPSIPHELHLGSTPLNEAIICALDIVPNFKKDTGVEKVNTVFLTDGHGNRLHRYYRHVKEENFNGVKIHSEGYYVRGDTKYVITDSATNNRAFPKKVKGHYGYDYQTPMLLSLLKKRVPSMNIVGFFIAGTGKSGRIDQRVLEEKFDINCYETEKFKELRNILKKENVLVAKSKGYDEFYILPGTKKLELNSDLNVEAGASKAEIKRAFSKMNNGKLLNRPVLNKFVKMVA